MLVDRFAAAGPVVIGLDDTIERRWGAKIKARGIYRDPVRSSHGHFVKASGLRWLSAMLLVPVPWAGRVWALPFLTVLMASERAAAMRGVSGRLELRHEARLLQLREHARDLAHGDAVGVLCLGEVVASGCQDAHTARDQRQDAGFLHYQLVREAGGILDQDDAHAVALDPVQQSGEPGARLDRVRA